MNSDCAATAPAGVDGEKIRQAKNKFEVGEYKQPR